MDDFPTKVKDAGATRDIVGGFQTSVPRFYQRWIALRFQPPRCVAETFSRGVRPI